MSSISFFGSSSSTGDTLELLEAISSNAVKILLLNAANTLTNNDWSNAQADVMSDATGYADTINASSTATYDATNDAYTNAVSDNTEISTNSTTFTLQKTINYTGTCDAVAFEQRASATNYTDPDQTTRVTFNYDDATSSSVDINNSTNTSYTARTATNPTPEKVLTSVTVYQKTSSGSVTAYARNFLLTGSGEAETVIIDVSGFNTATRAFVFVEGTGDTANATVAISDGSGSVTGAVQEEIDLTSLTNPSSITITTSASATTISGYVAFFW